MSLHKLTAGSGYDYLTRQVAAMDATEKGHTSLASYYTAKGETPGEWIGSGMAGIDGLAAGDVVTAEQMKALFAYGFHPLADQRLAELEVGAGEAAARSAQRLGTPYKVYDSDVPPFQIEVARRLEDLNKAAGKPRNAAVAIGDRARIRSEVAAEFFVAEHGRAPADERELAATVAKHTRPKTTAVAGYDLTFSPVKSVSTLWAIADTSTAARIEAAHRGAVSDALKFIEDEALFTRTGTNGVRQVKTQGLVATAFTHRDSRAGDPDLHTHVAVANKVQTTGPNPKWLAIDGRMIFKANVAASEVYNTALEKRLGADLGLRFAERPDTSPRKRPIREVVGVDPQLNARWSSRRQSIEARRAELTVAFQATHGRPPTPVEAIQLAQQATLETRDAKHEPRSLAEQRQTWASQAADALGGPERVVAMVSTSLNPPASARGDQVDAAWVQAAGEAVVDQVQQRRSSWQTWHLSAEARRQVRRADLAPEDVDRVVGLVLDAALEASVRIAGDADPVVDPDVLRRPDGSSVYTVAGADLFTSADVLAAEQRVVDTAGRVDGARLNPEIVDTAIEAADVDLNAGQAALVRGMATSGARVQLGIAAAGTGKTTAMSVLTRAWEDAGGTVIGLAPSAAAAAVLGEQTGATSDTLAKLISDLTADSPGPLADSVDERTLVLIDEAGMADTLTLDRAIAHVVRRGGSVRLIGDNQQLAAIGAGGVLRDIDDTHGSLRLAELMRFSDPAEGAASLALRDGLPESLGYYLDNDRVHVGDLATLTHHVFTAWADDTNAGLDSIMIASTRDLVADLNVRARASRVAAGVVDDSDRVALSDGTVASVGDVVLTRQNNRRLPISPTDWVKNGDRWTVTGLDRGALSVTHAESGLRVTLPADYVTEHTELGYASTVHTAQGLSVDTMHGIVTGDEARQQLYTMMTRGRHANHAYLVTAPDGDPHNLIRPETIHPETAVDVLNKVLARDATPQSATTMAREAAAPATQLGDAVARYTDALYQAAEDVVGPKPASAIEANAEAMVPGISDEPAWPVLRSHLILTQAQGRDAVDALAVAVGERVLDGVKDRAALLDWRLDPTGLRGAAAGPLPWLPAVPATVDRDASWGDYLRQRSDRVTVLAEQVRSGVDADGDPPTWARQGTARPPVDVLADVEVWRAAAGVESTDRRPTGPDQLQKAPAAYQRRLNDRVTGGRSPALAEWGPLLDSLHPRRDAFTVLLAERLAALSRAGVDASGLLKAAAADGPLPDDHVAAALWWRIARRVSPAVATEQTGGDGHISAQWSSLLLEHLGPVGAHDNESSPWWPTLISSVDRATAAGWAVDNLLDVVKTVDLDDVDPAQAMVWRIAVVTDPPPEEDEPTPPELLPPDDLHLLDRGDLEDQVGGDDTSVEEALQQAANAWDLLEPLELDDRDINRQIERAWDMDSSPISPERIGQANEAAAQFFEASLDGTWAELHLRTRLGVDIVDDSRFRPGYAPAGWTNLIDHLRGHGFTDDELLAAGLAKTASTGRLIDRFRDRAMLPVIADRTVLGFVGRRDPDVGDDTMAGPKYLNTPDTIVFHKGAQLFGLADAHMANGAIPVVVEGPMDAIAVTVASGGAFVGVAPLGTSLTDEQARQLATFDQAPIIATDGDTAGRVAAERDLWLLAPHLIAPGFVSFDDGQDPAGVLEQQGAGQLVTVLQHATALADAALSERLVNLDDVDEQITAAAAVIATQPPATWKGGIDRAAAHLTVSLDQVRGAVTTQAGHFVADRRRFVDRQLADIGNTRRRLEHAGNAAPAARWAPLARQLDPRLTEQPDWPATAQMLQEISDNGHDVATATQEAVATQPLGQEPASDLRYRLVSYLDDDALSSPEPTTTPLQPDPEPPTAADRDNRRYGPSW